MLKLPFTPYPIEGQRGPCPLCGSERSEALSRWDRRLKRLDHVKCAECGLIRHEAMPTDAALAEYYRASYRADYQNAHQGPSERHIAKRRAEAGKRLDRLSPHLRPGGALIDFGCGSGEFIEAARAAGYAAQGFEPGQDYATHARTTRGLPVENCGWQDYVAPESGVGAVTSFHVFEHLTDPVAAMTRAVSWLGDDGLVYIEVPNMANALQKGFGCLHMAHTIGFSRYTLELLGALCGLAVVDVVDTYDIGIVFRRGTPRDIAAIKADARAEMAQWTQPIVHRQYWRYTLGKLTGRKRLTAG